MVKSDKAGLEQAAAAEGETPAARVARQEAALRRLAALSVAPEGAGSDVVAVAPGRGEVLRFYPVVMVPDPAGGYRAVDLSYRNRTVMRRGDVFDRMDDQARRAGGVPMDARLVETGRRYAHLTERLTAGTLKLQRWGRTGGGDGRDVMDAVIGDAARLRRLHRAIGTGLALPLRRVRPSVSGPARVAVRDRALVDLVCLGGQTLSEVLRSHGWAVKGGTLAAARDALAACLDRMRDW